MLPILSLDDERFEEIVEKARKMIPNLSPDWTDYNYHDPGITIIELLAWLKELQQFHMDQIGPLHVRKYLMLLGESVRGRIPATVRLTADCLEEELVLPGGSRFYASGIEFESLYSRFLQPVRIVQLISVSPFKKPEEAKRIVPGGKKIHIPVFGTRPEGGESFYIGLSKPLSPGREHRIYFSFYDDYPVKRNPVNGADTFAPLAKTKMEAFCNGRFLPVENWRDGTYQFLENGDCSFLLPETMEAGEEGLYWLRVTLLQAEYDVPPILEWIGLNEIEVSQRHTLSECLELKAQAGENRQIYLFAETCLAASGEYEIYLPDSGKEDVFHRYDGPAERRSAGGTTEFCLPQLTAREGETLLLLCYESAFSGSRFIGTGNGFPLQEYETGITGLCGGGMVLLAETLEESGEWLRWEQVEDFTGSKPWDRHYTYDERTGMLCFGDCDRGMAPEGRILLAAGHTSLGQGGNVKAGTISRYEGPLKLEGVLNQEDAHGGADCETEEDCLRRLHRRLKTVERAVTYEDYETLVKRTPGLRIENVKAIPVTERKRQDGTMDETRVTLVVKPYSEDARPKPGRACLEGIMNMLEPRRMIGSKVSILLPEYIGITIFAEIETDSYYQQIQKEVGTALFNHFEERKGSFGRPVLYGTVYGIIDVLDHVTGVKSVSLNAQGSGIKRSMNGDILLPANGLAYLEEWDCMISSAG